MKNKRWTFDMCFLLLKGQAKVIMKAKLQELLKCIPCSGTYCTPRIKLALTS